MNTKNMMHEQISSFADGEVDESQIETALTMLRTREGRDVWEDYHQIGDVLRSDDMALSMSSDFTSRLMRRLDDEPAIVAAPRRETAEPRLAPASETNAAHRARRYMSPGVAAAVMAALTVVVAQQWMGADKDSLNAPAIASRSQAAAKSVIPVSTDGVASVPQERDLMRDPGIDEYLLAHQRFSPSLYSTAQYARSAAFAVDSDK